MPDAVVFGPESDRPSVDELLAAACNDTVAILQPQIDASVMMARAFTAGLQPMIDALNQMARALMPVMAVRREQISSGHREYHRRQRARRKRR